MGALPISPTAELSSQASFHRSGLVGGVRGAGTARMRTPGRGLRAGHIGSRFGEVVICQYRLLRSWARRRIFVGSRSAEGFRGSTWTGTEIAGRGGPTRLRFVQFGEGGHVEGYPLRHGGGWGGLPPAASIALVPGGSFGPVGRVGVDEAPADVLPVLLLQQRADVPPGVVRDAVELLLGDRRRDALHKRDLVELVREIRRNYDVASPLA